MSDAIYSPDVVIVGGGVAGLTVALNLAPRKVCVITKSSLGINTSSSWAQGGIAAAVSKDDSNESHINDTLTTAKGLANINAIKEVVKNANQLVDSVNIVFLENYNMHLGRLITSGVDLWLNTPIRPNEASGTSGMKAALNGVPNFSVIDGWWAGLVWFLCIG